MPPRIEIRIRVDDSEVMRITNDPLIGDWSVELEGGNFWHENPESALRHAFNRVESLPDQEQDYDFSPTRCDA